jgi:nucleotide-binding universal stress UspA family protein
MAAHTILYASDFSTASRRGFATALAMAKASRATLTILHVVVPVVPLVPEQYLEAATWDRINAQARRWGQRQLTALAQRARRAGVRSVPLLREGDPARQIVLAARSTRAGLLVVGTHGRRGLSKFILGSVAQRVVTTAPCPVVTVRGR